jgi:hypothetical protein
VAYHIYRPKDSDVTYGISIREGGAMLYQTGVGFGSFVWGEFTREDLDKIVEQYLSELAETFRLLEKLDENELDPSWW